MVIHAILIAVLAPVIKTRMEFDEKKEAQRTEEVKEREARRKEQDRLRREKQKLDEKTAKMLKREAELRKKEEIKQQVKELRKKRDEMMERRNKELEKFRQREAKDILAREKAAMAKIANKISEHMAMAKDRSTWRDVCVGCYPNSGGGIMGMLDEVKISKRIWSDEEISAAGQSPVSADHYWNFEETADDQVSGQPGELKRKAKLVDRADGEGKALLGDAKAAHAALGPIDFGDRFSIALSVKLDALDRSQLLFTNKHSTTSHHGLKILVEGAEDAAYITFQTSDDNNKDAKTSSVPGSFVFGKWSDIVVTAEMEAGEAAIFIDGVKAELSSGEVATEAYTEKTDLSELKELSDKVTEQLEEEGASPASTEELSEELEKLAEKISEKLSEVEELHGVRHEMAEAKEDIAEAQEALANLESKTDMAEMNNTDAAMADQVQPPTQSNDATAPASEMYGEAAALEKQIAAAKADMEAAGEAVSQNTSYKEAREKAMDTSPSRPDLEAALGGEAPATVGELNEFRESLNRAESEMQDMNARADAALGRSEQQALSASSFATGSAMASAAALTDKFGQVVDMTGFGGDGKGDSKEMRMDDSEEGAAMTYSTNLKALQLDEGKIIQAAMPGRRFTESSLRKGWLYLDTWYVIGPWENNSVVDYSIKHPPEFGIDFDAKYYDGKFADRPGHPSEVLKWEFYQSDQVRCQPPAVYGASTYYAYTDVWFEEARDMLIAVASDDASSVWLNGKIVWQDAGQSSWQLGEGYRKVRFNQGYNNVLVRIENGPKHCVWSVVLCPPEMLDKE